MPYEQGETPLHPGDRVVLYTDGVSEGARADGEMYGEERLHARIAGLPSSLSAQQQVDRVLAGLREFLAGVEPQDDVTVMVVRALAPQEPA
jgi:sigma-B regulation protein RsbU (phosphoserine phosphatase)